MKPIKKEPQSNDIHPGLPILLALTLLALLWGGICYHIISPDTGSYIALGICVTAMVLVYLFTSNPERS